MSDEAVSALLAFIHQLDTATQRTFLRLLEADLQVELDTDSARLRRIALALHQTTRALERSPSVREYNDSTPVSEAGPELTGFVTS